MPGTKHDRRFPGESPEYRDARDQLLAAEAELRTQIERVAAQRRKLPLGGAIKEDYTFQEGGADLNDRESTRSVRLSELFAGGKDSLVVYHFMFGPKMPAACPACTSILDGLNAVAQHVGQRVNLVTIARSPIQRIREFARARNWTNLRLLSAAEGTFSRDYHAEDAAGDQQSAMSIFSRRNGKIHHFYTTELPFVETESGQDPRHVDSIWPIWGIFDMTPEGRGKEWYPQLKY